YENAVSYYNALISSSRIYYRGNAISGLTLNNSNPPLNSIVTHNPLLGQISYSYEYDDRPTNCVNGALSETLTIIDNNPTDIFASLMILGRQAGPLLQPMNTFSSATREISVEVVMDPNSTCPSSQGNASSL